MKRIIFLLLAMIFMSITGCEYNEKNLACYKEYVKTKFVEPQQSSCEEYEKICLMISGNWFGLMNSTTRD